MTSKNSQTLCSLQTSTHEEFEFPETTFVRDIDNTVFATLVMEAVAKIDAVRLILDQKKSPFLPFGEHHKGIVIEQQEKNHSVSVRVELVIDYGASIPEKSQEVQTRITQEITQFTGLHVASVHVVFKMMQSIPSEAPLKHSPNESL